MTTVSHLLVLIEGDSTSLTAATTKASVATNGFAKTATTTGKTAQSSFSQIGTTAKSTLGTFVPFAAAGAALAVGQFAVASVTAASDNEEALNKTRVIFGDTSTSVEEFAENAAQSLGLSETAALQAASTFGTMLQAAGYAADEIDNMSIELSTLAADLASFNNIEVTDAIDKIRAGLSGESEPLRAVGVFLTEAKVQAEAYASGIATVGEELTEGQKIQARYNIILDETQNAQGDFERTSESLANQQRILTAEIENAQAELGQALLPVIADIIPVLTDFVKLVSPGLTGALEAVVPLLDTFGSVVHVISGDIGALNEEGEGIGGWFATATEKAQGWLGVIMPGVNFTNDLADATADASEETEGLATAAQVATGEETRYNDVINDTTEAQKEAAAATRDHRAAVMALRSPMLGLVDSAQQAAEAQEEVNRLERLGKTDTAAYSDAVLEALTSQTLLKEEVTAYAQELKDSGATAGEVKDALLEMAEGMGITREQFERAFGPVDGIWDRLKRINGLPRTQSFDVIVSYGTVGNIPGGLPHGIAAGGIVHAAAGMITRGPTILAGEGSYSTFAGRGAEAVIPLNSRGIAILGEAMKRAMGGNGHGGKMSVTIRPDRRRFTESVTYDKHYGGGY